jgi:hypothetical protein
MDASAALVKVLREEGPRVLATLVRHLGDLPWPRTPSPRP